MDQVGKQQADNTSARFGFALLATLYGLCAFFTSVPLQNTPVAKTANQLALAAISHPVEVIKAEYKPLTWWQNHQNTALLTEKWWQSHQVAHAKRTKAVAQLKVPKSAITSLRKKADVPKMAKALPRPEDRTSARVAVQLPKPVAAPKKPRPVNIGAPAPESETDLVRKLLAEPEAGFKLAAKLDKISRPVQKPTKTSHASLIPIPSSAPPVTLKKISFTGLVNRLPGLISEQFSKDKKPSFEEQTGHQCVADRIAGWSGIDLLPRHRQLIEKNKTEFPDISQGLAARLAARGFTPGSSVFMRIFKDKSELEVWLMKGEKYALYRSYKICRWSGSFGPKLYEGDKQSPEGFYLVNRQLFERPSWKWKDSFSIGYPNAYDKLHGRTGSLILVHGGCTSSGCFAMTNPVIKEVHELAQLARDNGQKKFSMHVYPFKLSSVNLKKYKKSAWLPFWKNLKEGYDLFESTRLPPRVRVCNKRYVFAKHGLDRAGAGWSGKGCYGLAAFVPGWKPASRISTKGIGKRNRRLSRRSAVSARRKGVRVRCNLNRPSCRKWVSMKRKKPASKRRKSVRRKAAARKRYAKRQSKKRRAAIKRARAIGPKEYN